MEELHRDSLSGLDRGDAATLAAWGSAASLEGKDVVDVNGLRLGRVTRSFAEEGLLARLDVTIDGTAQKIADAAQRVAGIPPHWIARVDDDGIHLLKAAEQVLRPDDPRPLGAEEDRGAKGPPRKNR